MERPPAPADETSVDVIVVGGGLSGILVAERLAGAGVQTLVLEAGPVLERKIPGCNLPRFREVTAPLLEVDESLWAYRSEGVPYTWRRVRAGGGRSLVWGGWSLRPSPHSFADARAWGRPWPFDPELLDLHLRRVEQWLGVREGDLEPQFFAVRDKLGLPVQAKRAAVGPCGCRPFVSLDRRKKARLRSDSIVTRVLVGPRRRVTGVELADAKSGTRSVLRARAVVLSASPIESARLLFASGIHELADLPALGRGFTEHLVASYLVLLPHPVAAGEPPTPIQRVGFVPRFVNLGRRQRRDYRGGFVLELHGPEPLAALDAETLRELELGAVDPHAHAFYTVHAIGELGPNAARYVDVHPSECDRLGRPLPRVHLAWTDEDRAIARDMSEAGLAVADALAVPGSRIFPIRDALRLDAIAHEAGTCAMGARRDRAVTDLRGKVLGMRGLYVADGSLMPTGLDRPPTLTALALALNTADGMLEASGRGEA